MQNTKELKLVGIEESSFGDSYVFTTPPPPMVSFVSFYLVCVTIETGELMTCYIDYFKLIPPGWPTSKAS